MECRDPNDQPDEGQFDDDLGPIRCWCGAEGLYSELFDTEQLEESCGGGGVLYCYCGGDQCVCHNHGEVPCEGCEDCEDCDPLDDDDYADYDEDELDGEPDDSQSEEDAISDDGEARSGDDGEGPQAQVELE